MAPASASLVIASYNQTNALALVLEAVLRLQPMPQQIVFADDGSEADTPALVEAFRRRCPVPVEFTTQEDRGFRKAKALNNAVRRCTGDVLLFLDGDCIPPRDWAAQHLDAIGRGADFATAGYVMMDLPRTQAMTREDVASGRFEATITDAERRELRRIHRLELLYRLIGRAKKPKILGGNWACRRDALVAVNGHDERFDGFSKEDSDVRNRLRNAGRRGVSLWDRNWVFHCSHDFDPRRTAPGVWRKPPDLTYYDSRRRAVRAELGLVDETQP